MITKKLKTKTSENRKEVTWILIPNKLPNMFYFVWEQKPVPQFLENARVQWALNPYDRDLYTVKNEIN